MSKCFIGFGKCSKYYLYILGTVIFKCLKDCIFGFTSINPESKIGLFGIIPKLSNHFLIQSFYRYISFIFGGLIFMYISKNNSKKEKRNIDTRKTLILKSLIYNKNTDGSKKTSFIEIFKVCFAFCFHQEISVIMYLFVFFGLDFWIFDIIFIILFMDTYFIITFFRHQKLSIIFIIITNTILLIVSSFLPLTDHGDTDEKIITDENTYNIIKDMTESDFAFLIIFVTFIILSCIISYGRVKAKVLMYFNYISPYKIIFYIGIMGTVLISIALLLVTKYDCHGEIRKIQNYCVLIYNDNNVTKYYYDNINIYFNDLKNNITQTEFYLEIILITPLYLVINFLEFTCEILVINYLNPIFVLVRDNLYYAVNRILFILINLQKNYMHYITLTQFFITESNDILALIGYSVYLEIIELRFCDLDKDLKVNIIERGNRESLQKKLENSIEDNRDSSFGTYADEKSNNNNKEELELI